MVTRSDRSSDNTLHCGPHVCTRPHHMFAARRGARITRQPAHKEQQIQHACKLCMLPPSLPHETSWTSSLMLRLALQDASLPS